MYDDPLEEMSTLQEVWQYSKTFLKGPLKNRQNKGLKDKW